MLPNIICHFYAREIQVVLVYLHVRTLLLVATQIQGVLTSD